MEKSVPGCSRNLPWSIANTPGREGGQEGSNSLQPLPAPTTSPLARCLPPTLSPASLPAARSRPLTESSASAHPNTSQPAALDSRASTLVEEGQRVRDQHVRSADHSVDSQPARPYIPFKSARLRLRYGSRVPEPYRPRPRRVVREGLGKLRDRPHLLGAWPGSGFACLWAGGDGQDRSETGETLDQSLVPGCLGALQLAGAPHAQRQRDAGARAIAR
ncbi:hypothetical protein F4809DRAFT_396897 [Biscogniauxia mediterranea]|nr:hypothetical protein F4809DRAFT_396897 [Biscogniauxia mediterranea]